MSSDQARTGKTGGGDRPEDHESSGEFPAAPRSRVQATTSRNGASAGDADALVAAQRRLMGLKGLERQVFHAFAALGGVLRAEEDPHRLNPCVAIGFELRPNTVHQHLSRARHKLFPGVPASLRDADRLVVAPPDDVARAGRAYLDVVAAHPGVAKGWADAHEHHAEQRQASKVASAAAADAWHAFLKALDGSRVQPRDVREHLRRTGDEPRIFEWIPSQTPSSANARRWTAVLDGLPRPTGAKRAGWARLVAEHAFGSLAGRAFDVFEARSERAEQALATLNDAWKAWLAASERMPGALRDAKNLFRERIQAWCLGEEQ
jgi:hypothetical protein